MSAPERPHDARAGRPAQEARERLDALCEEVLFLSTQPTFETKRGTRRRRERFRRKLRELKELERETGLSAVRVTVEPEGDGPATPSQPE